MIGWFVWQWRKVAHRHETPPPPGYGSGGPERNFLMRCCRCGKLRLWGKAVEQHGPPTEGEIGRWWHECLECALESADKAYVRLERAREEVDAQ